MDINSIKTQLENLLKKDDLSHATQGARMVYDLSQIIRSNELNTSTILSLCDILLQTQLSERGNIFQITSLFDGTTMRLIIFLEALLEKELSLAVYNILIHQSSENEAKPAGYNLAHGRHKESFYEKIINKLPEDLKRNLENAAFVIYLDEERTEAVEYDVLGDGVRYLL